MCCAHAASSPYTGGVLSARGRNPVGLRHLTSPGGDPQGTLFASVPSFALLLCFASSFCLVFCLYPPHSSSVVFVFVLFVCPPRSSSFLPVSCLCCSHFCFMIFARSFIHPACSSCSLLLLILPTCAAIVSSRPAAVLPASSSLLRPNIVVSLVLLVVCPALAIMRSRPAICIALL